MARKTNKTEWAVSLISRVGNIEFSMTVWKQILDLALRHGWEPHHSAFWSKENADDLARALEESLAEDTLVQIDDLELMTVCADYRRREIEALIEFCQAGGFLVGRSRRKIQEPEDEKAA